MAVTVTRVHARAGVQVWDVVATADGDTAATLIHAFGSVPQEVSITPLTAIAAAVSFWAVTAINNRTVVVTKATTATTGQAPAQLKVIVRRAERHGV